MKTLATIVALALLACAALAAWLATERAARDGGSTIMAAGRVS